MADFSNYTTPDGRTVRFPPALAQNFAGLTPEPDPNDTGLMVPGGPESMPVPQQPPGAGVSLPPPVPVMSEPMPAMPQAAPQQQPPAPQQPAAPKTDADLRQIGLAGALGAQTAAVDQAGAAGRKLADAQAQEMTAMADAFKERNAKLAEQEALRQQAAQEKMQRVQAASIEADRAMKAYADHKVDRSLDHPMLAAISLALSAAGSAMAGKSGEVPALGIMLQQMDKKVQLQLADRAKMKDVAGAKQSAIDRVRQMGDDQIAVYNLGMAGETEKAIRKIEEIKARSGSDQVKANAEIMIGELQGKKAGFLANTVERRFALDEQKAQRDQQAKQHAQSVGVQYAQLAESKRHNIASEELTQEQRDIEAKKAAAAGNVAMAKLINERAMGGEATPVKDKDGFVIDHKIGLITKKDGSVWIPGGTEASVTDLQKKHSAATALVQTLDKIRALGPEWLSDVGNSDKKQQLDQLMGDARLQAIAAKGLGVPTGHDIELAERFIGTTDPTRWKDSLSGIMQSRDSIVRDHNVELQTHGLDKPWSPPDLGTRVVNQSDPRLELLSKAPLSVDSAANELGATDDKNAGRIGSGKRQTEFLNKALADNSGMLPSQKRQLDIFASAMAGNDPQKREDAGEMLTRIVKLGGNPAIKAYAQQLLTNATSGDVFANATPEQVR